jgi:glycosyltransferase involved in cell wall biosynthesis
MERRMLNKLNLIGPVQNQTSYGETVISLTTELTKLGVEVSLFPIGGNVSLDPLITTNHNIIKEAVNRSFIGFDKNSISLRLYHPFSMAEQIGRTRVGFSIFELSRFNKIEEHQLKQLDHMVVTSKWAKSIVDKQIGIPCSVVPLGVDTSVFVPIIRSHTTTRICICGKIEHRKCTREIIETFCSTFNKDDNVELHLCIANIFNTKEENVEWERYIKTRTIADKIFLLPRFPSSLDVSKMLSSMDVLASMSRAEGWNLPCLQMLATGGHVIATNNTAQTEFLNNNNSLLIETPDTCDSYDGKWFKGDNFEGEKGKWYIIGNEQKQQLSNYMREIHELKQSGKLEVNKSGYEDAQKFTWKNSAKCLVEVLEIL